MTAAAVIAIVLAVIVILLLGGFLLIVGRVLAELNRQLRAVTEAVGTMAAETEPVDSAVESINRDLGNVQELLSTLRESEGLANGTGVKLPPLDAPDAPEAPVRPPLPPPGRQES